MNVKLRRKNELANTRQVQKPSVTEITRVSNIETMMDSALAILDDQILKMHLKAKSATLEEKEVRVLKAYISSLVELSREARERTKDDMFADMSDAELVEYVEALKAKKVGK